MFQKQNILRMKTSSQEQIQHINQFVKELENYSALSLEELVKRPGPDQWSLIEIIGHLNLAYQLYRDRMQTLLDVLPDQEEPVDEISIKGMKGFFIRNQAPINGQRKWKMKTFKFFRPVFDLDQINEKEAKEVFKIIFDDLEHLKTLIKNSRFKDCSKGKFHSAIGPALKFTLPQAIAFNISHIERHLLQMKETFEEVKLNLKVRTA